MLLGDLGLDVQNRDPLLNGVVIYFVEFSRGEVGAPTEPKHVQRVDGFRVAYWVAFESVADGVTKGPLAAEPP